MNRQMTLSPNGPPLPEDAIFTDHASAMPIGAQFTAAAQTKSAAALVSFLALCFAAAASGTLLIPDEWYPSLRTSAWNPPGWLFGPVWTLLYAGMAVAAWRVWLRGGWASQRRPLGMFLAQLALNAAWPPLLFGLHLPRLAFLEILLLWLAVVRTSLSFRAVDRPAAWLVAPYLGWVTFASALNFGLWRLNS